MIIFGNLYHKNTPRFNIVALYQNGQLQAIDKEMKKELFPNAGAVFVPHDIFVPSKIKYGLYEIYESPTYEPEKPTSHKYALGSEVKDVMLYEVIQIRESVHAEHLYEKFQNGFRFPYEPLANVLIHTEDDFLIGPLQLKKRSNDDVWEVPDANFVPYRRNNLEFLRYENAYVNEPERFFVVSDITREPEIGYVDIASNERAIREILKLIRENADFGELTRKVIRQLGEWGNTGYISEPHLQQRLQRVIRILKSHTLDETLMEDVQKTVFNLPYVQSHIKKELESYQLRYRKQFEEEHRELSGQVKQLKADRDRITRELDVKRKEKDRLEQSIQQLQAKTEEKIAEIQSNVLEVFINQLTLKGLAFSEISSALSRSSGRISAEPSLYALTLNLRAPVYDKLEDFWAGLEQQIRIPEYRLLAQTIACAVAIDSPIVITGKRSLELAQLLAQSVAANETITVLPEVHSFSLEGLVEKFKSYQHEQAVKALILHNAHLTSAEFSLPAFLTLKRWSNESMVPDLVILSIDEPETATEFLNKFQLPPVLDADSLIKKPVPKRFDRTEGCGQLMLTMIDKMSVEGVTGEREAFEEWLLDKHGLELNPWPKQFDDWLVFLSLADSRQAVLFQWMWRMFERYWQHENQRSEAG